MTSIDDLDEAVAAVTFGHDDDSVVVVIGSGAGGGTLANELCQKGIDVVLLESGPRLKSADFENDEVEMFARLTWFDRRITAGESTLARDWPSLPTWICKTTGGSTVHWAGQSLRFREHEFKPRTTYGALDGANLIDWPISLDEVLPYYERAEDKMGVSGRGGRPLLPPNNNFKVVALGAKRMGYTDYDVSHMAINSVPYDGRNACDQIGFCMQGCKSEAKWSTLYTEIPRAEATGRCEVRHSSMALKIEHNEAGRATGVLYADPQGDDQLQKARAVCAAGNSIESPRLLLNSESSMFPDGLANSSGQVGKNYVRNMTSFVYGIFDKPVNMHRGAAGQGIVRDESWHKPERGFAGGIWMTSCGLGLPNVAGFMRPGGWGRDYTQLLEQFAGMSGIWACGEDMPMEKNGITLHPTEKDQYGLPVPVVSITEHPNDVAMRNYSHLRVTQLFDAAGAVRTVESALVPGSHNLGTCRMSEKADEGVVNAHGQTHDVANLFVSDGSQFASSFTGNPTLTIVALAIRQAEHIAAKMQGNEI